VSEQNGDRARYQRLRLAGVRRRERSRQVHAELRRQAARTAAVVGDVSGRVTPTDAGVDTKAEGI
jgi:hypothetical protein